MAIFYSMGKKSISFISMLKQSLLESTVLFKFVSRMARAAIWGGWLKSPNLLWSLTPQYHWCQRNKSPVLPLRLSEPMFSERPIPLQTLQHWSLPVSQPGVSWPVLFSCHTLQWRIPGDPWPAWSDKELWMKLLSVPDVALTANSCNLCNAQPTSRTDALRKNQMTLCRTSYIWPLPCKPDPAPLFWHINTALHWNFLPMQEQQAQRQKHCNNMKRKDRIVLPLDLFHHRKIKWKTNLTKVKLLSRRLFMLNLFLGRGTRLQEPGTEQQVWDPRNAREPPS